MKRFGLSTLKFTFVFLLILFFDFMMESLFIDSCLDNGGMYIDKFYPVVCKGHRSLPGVGNILRFFFMGLTSFIIIFLIGKINEKWKVG